MTDPEEPRYRTHCVGCGGRFLAPQVRPTVCEECAAEEEAPMSVVSVPVTDIVPGDIVNRPGHGWFAVKEPIPIEFGNRHIFFMALVLDHPDHEVTATQKHLLSEEFPCVLYVPIHAKVSVQV